MRSDGGEGQGNKTTGGQWRYFVGELISPGQAIYIVRRPRARTMLIHARVEHAIDDVLTNRMRQPMTQKNDVIRRATPSPGAV